MDLHSLSESVSQHLEYGRLYKEAHEKKRCQHALLVFVLLFVSFNNFSSLLACVVFVWFTMKIQNLDRGM